MTIKRLILEMMTEALKSDSSSLAGHKKESQVYLSPDPEELGSKYDDDDKFDAALARQERKHNKLHDDAIKKGYKVNNSRDSDAAPHKKPDITMVYDPEGTDAYAGHIVHHNGKAALDPAFHVKAWHQGHLPDVIADNTPEQIMKYRQ